MDIKDCFQIKVKCYEGYKSEEKPISFLLGNKEVHIKEIIDQWYGENHRYFKIYDTKDNIYIIRQDYNSYIWEIVFMSVTT